MYFSSCKPEDLPPNISEISKSDREKLGDQVLIYLEENHVACNVLFKEDYPFVFNYIQELYDFATFFPKEDIHSPDDNKWNKKRQWRVVLVNQEEKKAFCLPAGHFVISTGFLKSIKYEYELFYIMNFEIALMNEKYLLRALVQKNKNPQPLLEVASGHVSGKVSRQSIGRSLSQIVYDPAEYSMKALDRISCANICQNSTFSNLGIVDVINKIGDSSLWMLTRPSYPNREAFITQLTHDGLNCAEKKWGYHGAHFYRDSIISLLP